MYYDPYIFKKSQIKIPHFFPVPWKLFLLITLFKDFTSYRDSFFNWINRNNFCGAGKKWGIFFLWFFKKNTDRICTYWSSQSRKQKGRVMQHCIIKVMVKVRSVSCLVTEVVLSFTLTFSRKLLLLPSALLSLGW